MVRGRVGLVVVRPTDGATVAAGVSVEIGFVAVLTGVTPCVGWVTVVGALALVELVAVGWGPRPNVGKGRFKRGMASTPKSAISTMAASTAMILPPLFLRLGWWGALPEVIASLFTN